MRRTAIALHACAALTSVAVLGPALGPGYVLSYDMVFTPRLPFTADAVGLGSGLPRAVPQDALVSVASLLIRGDVLQKIALVAAVYLAVLGAARLVPTERLLPRLAAGVAYGWNAYFAERLLLGHWSLLLAYAALPWLVRATLNARRGGSLAPIVGWSALAAITPTGGLLALGVTVLILAWPNRQPSTAATPEAPAARPAWTFEPEPAAKAPATEPGRRRWWAAVAVLALNAPWLVAGMLATGAGRSDPAGVDAFAARSENWSGAFGSLLGLGGVWNRQAVPVSRESVLAPLLTILVLVVAYFGIEPLRRRWPAGDAGALFALAGGGLVLALLGIVPGGRGLLRWLVDFVPGAGLLRDGQKFLAPFALLLALGFALGVERLVGRLTDVPARLVLAAAVVFPIVALPDLAWGGLGRLEPTHFPADWGRVASHIAASPSGRSSELVALPFSAFRAYDWNGERTSLDPTPRYVSAPVLVDDRLAVGSRVLAGESDRARIVLEALGDGRPLTETGVRWVLVQHGTPGAVPSSALAGLQLAYDGPNLTLYENRDVRDLPDPSPVSRIALALAYVAAITAALAALAGRLVITVRREVMR